MKRWTFDIHAVSQVERIELQRDTARHAQAVRADAVRRLFRASAHRGHRPRLLLRALVSSAIVVAAVISFGAILLSAPVAARVGVVSIGYLHR